MKENTEKLVTVKFLANCHWPGGEARQGEIATLPKDVVQPFLDSGAAGLWLAKPQKSSK